MGDCYIVRRAGEAKKLPVLNASYPADLTIWAGETATFKVEIATDGVPAEYTYQWYRDGAKWTEATNATVSWSGASIGSHSIYCVVTNKAGEVTSRVATLTVKDPNTSYTYTGDHEFVDDGNGNWRVKFKSSGTLVFPSLGAWDGKLDVFCVGGGGSGGGVGFGGGGGYTTTETKDVVEGVSYQIVIGAGGAGVAGNATVKGNDGGTTSAFGVSANGGQGGKSWSQQGAGEGSGGGSGGGATGGKNGQANVAGGAGGTDGSNGGASQYWSGGAGQGTTTREFGESSYGVYAGGGGGWGSTVGDGGNGGGGAGNGTSGKPNTGGGGGAANGTTTGAGGSGIAVIRNHR